MASRNVYVRAPGYQNLALTFVLNFGKESFICFEVANLLLNQVTI
jgi:hypothetical protein